jgi:hypothetical protein
MHTETGRTGRDAGVLDYACQGHPDQRHLRLEKSRIQTEVGRGEPVNAAAGPVLPLVAIEKTEGRVGKTTCC